MRKFSLVLLCLYSFCANAQHSDSTTRDSSIVLSGAEVVGVRADLKTPVSQKNISGSEIRKGYFGQDMPVILNSTPSFTYYSDGGNYMGYMYMRLRGIDQTRINMTLNGVPLNESEDEGCYFSNFTDFASNISSLQIQRGVGTSTNGVASYGGSINFESKNPLDSAGTEIQTGMGSFNSNKLSVSCNTGLLNNKTAFYARYSSVASDGYRYYSGTNAGTFFLSGGYFGEKDILKITSFSGRAQNEMAYLAASKSDIDIDRRVNYLSPSEKDDFTQNFVQLQHTHRLTHRSYISNSLYYVGLKGNYDVLFGTDMYNFGLSSDFYGAFSSYNWANDKTKITIGVHSNNYRRDHFLGLRPIISDRIYFNSGHKKEASAFAKISRDFGKLTLFGDIQERVVNFEYHPYSPYGISVAPITWVFFNPKGGATYTFNDNVNVYCSVGQTHREPTRNDMFAGADDIDTNNVSEVGDFKKVKPESVIDFELGTNVRYKNISVQADVYDMEFTNEIAAIGQLSYIGLPLRKNVASSYRRGFELDLKWQLTKNLSISNCSNLSHNIIREYTDDYDSVTYKNVNYLLAPNVIIKQGIAYSFGKICSVNAVASYSSKSYLTNTSDERYTNSTTTKVILSCGMTVFFMKRNSVSFQINNLTNSKYFNSGYVQNGESYYYVAPTRNFFVTLNLKF